MNSTILYYLTTDGKEFIIVNEDDIISKINNVEKDTKFIKWYEDSLYQIDLIKNSIRN